MVYTKLNYRDWRKLMKTNIFPTHSSIVVIGGGFIWCSEGRFLNERNHIHKEMAVI